MCTLAQIESLINSKIKVHLKRQNAQLSEQVANPVHALDTKFDQKINFLFSPMMNLLK